MIEHRPAWFVAIEGPTGVGKTTLVRRLAPWLEADPVFDPFESNPFLALLFAADTPAAARRWGLVTELTFLGLRVNQLRDIAEALTLSRLVLADWSMVKQMIFADLTLDQPDRHQMAETCAIWSEGLPIPDLIIHLRADIMTLQRRIVGRGRPMESGLSTADLAALAASYDAALASSPVPVINVEYSAFDVSDDVAVADLARHIKRILRRGT